MERIKILSEKDVSLVAPEKEDIFLWYKWMNDIDIQSKLLSFYGQIITYKNEEEYFDSINKDDKNLTFSIYIEDIKKTIWNVSLMNIDYKNSHAELWIAIFDRTNQWKWYGTKTLKLAQKYCFEILWLNKLYLRYLSTNKVAGNLYKNCWFKEVWRLKQHFYIFWEYHDGVIMEILKKEYFNL